MERQGITIPKELAEKLKVISVELKGRSLNSLVEQCVEEMVVMVETPELEREIPGLIKQVDSVRKIQKFADQEEAEAQKKARE
jgi:metal-responsive CopG/Arc/MetJ family transcriptional regulator